MRQSLTSTDAELEDSTVQALDQALATVVEEEVIVPAKKGLDNRTVIAQTRDWVNSMSNHLGKRERDIASRIAIATKERDEAIVRANDEHAAVTREAEVELYQITTTREALALAHARLQKAEVQ